RQRLSVKVANWPPLFSHFSCLFHGSAVSGLASGSLTNATFSFWVAQETSVPAAASNKPVATALSNLRIRTSIDDNISGLHLDTSDQCAGYDIAYSGCRFN